MSKAGVEDMVMLTDVSETGIMANLKKRFHNSQIYTYIGAVLVSINPYRNIEGLYSERLLKDYRGKYPYELPAHVFAIADQVYRQLMQEGKPQCVIISGESGAGKTEASKKILQYIAAASSNSADVARVKDVILSSNPLLEAFGNAKTIRNNNSSRFGKYMEIHFNMQGDPEGGLITNYLLEKSRVVRQTEGERNFHVFYQLLAGADAATKQEFNLRAPQQYHYLNQSGCYTVDDTNDAAEFQDTVHAMAVMGLSPTQQKQVLRVLACILTLGNLQFAQTAKDEAYITNKDELEWLAFLLEVDQTAAQNAIVQRTIESGSQRQSVFKCPQNVEGAVYSRDALAKELYSRLFDFVVRTVNTAMYKDMAGSVSVGILDIYGFEIFDRNGFEQLCINFVNEKLQQVFIQLTLREEQEEYVKEGIKWTPVTFFDNAVVCQLIEAKKPIGIFTLLDDVCNFPSGSDAVFHQKMGQEFAGNQHFEYGAGTASFVVKHYAGPVEYAVDGMMDRNKDTLYNDLIDICAMSASAVVQSLFPEATSKRDKKRPTTAGFKIKTSINELVNTLNLCSPHYIRCLKPNDHKRSSEFDEKRCLHQIQYLGLLENVRVRRAGFAYRHPYRPFYFRYRLLSNATWPEWRGSERDATQKILESMQLKLGEDYQLGNSKIFIRKPESVFALEEKREQLVTNFANRIQRFFTQFALQQWYYELQVNGNKHLEGHKERRRQSVALRKFNSDYINFRENFELKKLVEGREKVYFADMATKYDRRGKPHRRVMLVSNAAYYEISLEANPDKNTAAKKPFVYLVKRRVEWKQVRGVTLSTLQDGFMLWQLPDYDTVLECRRKTEFLANAKQQSGGALPVTFSDAWSVVIKGGKHVPLALHSDGSAPAHGVLKGRDVRVAPGEARNAVCQVERPADMPRVEVARRPVHVVAQPRAAPPPQQPRPQQAMVSPRPTPAAAAAAPAPAPAPGPGPVKAKQPKKAPGAGGGAGVGGGGAAAVPAKAKAGAAKQGPGGAQGAKNPAKKAPQGAKAPAKAVPDGPKGVKKGAPVKAVKFAGRRAKAQWAFEAINQDELGVAQGDVVTVLDGSSDDWWRCELGGKRGIVPKTYLALI